MKTVSLTMKALGGSVNEVNHKFNVVYAPTRLTVSQEAELPTFWENARGISHSIMLKVQVQRSLLDISMSSLSSEPSNVGELTRDYKKLMDFSAQQSNEKRELQLQLNMLKRLDEEREEKAVRPQQAPSLSLLHLVLSVFLGLVAGILLFRTS